MAAWSLLLAQVILFSAFPFAFTLLSRGVRDTLFYVYLSVLLVTAGVLGAVYTLPLTGTASVSFGGIVYSALVMTTMMMFIVSRDLRVVRNAIRLVVVVNLFVLVVLGSVSTALTSPAVLDSFGIPSEAFRAPVLSALVGGALNVVQLILMAAALERLKRLRLPRAALIVGQVAVFLLVLALDGALFPTLLIAVEPTFDNLLASGLVGVQAKLLVAAVFSVPLATFLLVFPRQVEDFLATPESLRGLFVTPRDELVARIAEQHTELEEVTRRLQDTLESMTDGVLILDDQGRFTYLNRSAERVFGVSREEAIGHTMDVRFPQRANSEFHRAYDRAVREGTPQRVVAYADPLGRWIEAEAYPSDLGLVVYFRDVTDRVEREQHLETIAAAEQAAADRLRYLNQVKDTFLTAVSHELRTPLTVVKGMAQTLQRLRDVGVDEATRAHMEDAIVDNAQQLTDLIDDLLDIDRLARDALRVEPVGFDLVERTRVLVAASPIASRIELDVPEHLEVTADPIRCDRILHNLLDNAAKYAPDGAVRVRLAALPGRGAVIEVRDQGPGIPSHELAQVFEPFHRSDTNHPQPGTGIGLALVAEFASLHGGRAFARDTKGSGAHLVVELPGDPTPPNSSE